ncbi:hypothetical protein [Clostridium sp. C105KSO13]|uniref:hypothetical protein n=1 Tax=Clostridium sp. C105KSO13 TaxID=1776045 RepID=UPI00074066E1|nr:hypothetical protein [Clostridium sp. C105KSO13]CUX51497.1 hypothetical protein BN3456_03008 [Clostridium sp. C105KSO13]
MGRRRDDQSKKGWVIWLTISLLLIALLAGGYFLIKEHEKRPDRKETQKPEKENSDEQSNGKTSQPDESESNVQEPEKEPELTEEEKRELDIDKILKDMPWQNI